jgi:hypothetical protein
VALHAKARAVGWTWLSLNCVLSTQCLDRRIPDKQILTEEVAAGAVS